MKKNSSRGCNLKKTKGREESGGIVYASCTSMLVAIETVFQTIIYI